METKSCCSCKEEKPVTEFHRNSNSKDGYKSKCKLCRTKKNSPKQYERLMLLEEERKRCPSCNEIKDLEEFSLSPNRWDGHRTYCKECRRKKYKEWYYSNLEKSRESARKRTRKYRENNPEVRERDRRTAREYYYNNKDRKRKYQKEWRRGKGRNKFLLQLQRRREREEDVENTLTDGQIRFLLEFQGNKCASCGIIFSNDYTLDHIVPLSMGKGLTLDNAQLLCKSCNSSKGTDTTKYRKDIKIESVLCMI